MWRGLILICLLLFLTIVTSPAYSSDKVSLNNPVQLVLSNTQSVAASPLRETDFSSEYALAQSLLQKDVPTQVLSETRSEEEKPVSSPDPLPNPVSTTPSLPVSLAQQTGAPAPLQDASHSPDASGLKSFPDTQKDSQKTEIGTLYKTYGFNKAVEKSIHYYSKKIKEKFSTVLSRSGKYLSMISEIFKEKDLPQELVFLPLIESGFNMYAYSPKRASGLWQFIASTAKRYGLKIDWWVDERRDPIKATVAAAEYLSDLYNMFGSWNLALAAYNAGEWKILKALDKTKTADFWALRNTKHIKKETKDYIPFYIAATAIAKDPEGFGFQNVNYYEPMTYDEVVIDAPMDIEAIARYAEVDVKEIKELNPGLKRWCTPLNVSSYTLRIPVGTKEKFLANISNNTTDENNLSIDYYTVKKGDTVKKIASRLGISTEAILELNSLDKNSHLRRGLTIFVPPKEVAHLTKDTEYIKGKKGAAKYKKQRKTLKKKRKSYLVTSTL